MKTKTIIIVVVILVLLGFAYWYFIGPAFTTQRVDDVLPYDNNIIEIATVPEQNYEAKVVDDEVIILKQGEFTDADMFHKGSGQAKVMKKGDKYYLTLENFRVTNGPDLFVYLSENKDVKEDLGEHKNLHVLKGNEGNQVYEITKEDAENFESVAIWCKRFGVLFSSASLV